MKIKKQIHLLSLDEIFMLYILESNIKVNIFYLCDVMLWYSTSHLSSYKNFSVSTLEFRNYKKEKERFNQHRKNVYISVLKKSKYDFLYIEHFERLSNEDIAILNAIEQEYLQYVETCEKEINNIINSINL